MKVNLPLIKDKRKEKGLNINDMAEKLNLANGSVYWKRENDMYKFKSTELATISKILDIPLDDLFLLDEYSKIEII